MLLLGEELTTFTLSNQVLSVSQGGGLVETRPKGFSHQICGGCVVAAFPTMDLLQELKTFRSEDALHQHTIGGGPPVQLGADDDVVGATPDDFLTLNLVFRDAFLQDVGDKVEALVIFDLHHEDEAAAR
jgi:hypothetical protein